jgi:type IV/VI secretion system ImpK/VasF family protein
MTLLELCEPLFQYVCRLNRMSRKGGSPDGQTVRAELRAILSDLKARADQQGALAVQYEKMELPLLFFVDFMIRESRLSFASTWKDFAHERREMAGYEKFFELLDETLSDPSEGAVQRLMVYYTCIGLGFTGIYVGQPEVLRRKMLEISNRLRGQIQTMNDKITPESYEGVDSRSLTEPPVRGLLMWGVALVVMAGAVFGGYVFMYYRTESRLKTALTSIQSTLANGPETKGN